MADDYAINLPPKLLALRPSNPFPPLDRRWQIATFFASSGEQLPKSFVDRWVSYAWRLLKDRGSIADPWISACNQEASHCRGSTGHSVRIDLHELKARLLADQSNEQIAARMQLRPEQVEAFERLHFAVRDRLAIPAYIVHRVIRRDTADPIDRLGMLWKEFAYAGGPLALDLLVDTFRSFPLEVQKTGIFAYASSQVECPTLVRQAVRIRTVTITPRKLLSELNRLDENNRYDGSATGFACRMSEQLVAMKQPTQDIFSVANGVEIIPAQHDLDEPAAVHGDGPGSEVLLPFPLRMAG